MLGIGRGSQHRVMAVGVEAKHHLGARRFFHSQALCADGHATIGADVKGGAHAPHIIPPGQRGVGRSAERFSLRA